MSCFQEIEYVLFLDGELSGEKKEKLTKHLSECPQCQRILAQMKKENSELNAAFAVKDGFPDISAGVLAGIDSLPPEVVAAKRSRLSWLKWAGAAAASLAAVLLAFHMLKPRPDFSPEVQDVLVTFAYIEGKEAVSYIFNASDPDTTFIWLEKIKDKEDSHEKDS